MKIAYGPASADAGHGFAKRRFLTVSAIAVAALAAGNAARAQTPVPAGAAKKFKAIVHLTDGEPDKWGRVLGFVQGLESTSERADLAIALVVQGLASDMLKADASVAKALTAAISRGVEVLACEYSLKVRKIDRGELNPGVTNFVAFGGMEIVKRQAAGWAYLRP